ncbi:PIN domain-containing protein [Candidatus Gottesmanbacteria bacterium]|nr:PIN domain-containing protein [Candidatus Gottesmanbacteria bacterium]
MLDFLDTNLIIRHLTRDNPEQSERSRKIFKRLEEGSYKVVTSEATIIEAVQVLSSKKLYHLSRESIKTYLTAIIALPGLKLTHKKAFFRALELFSLLSVDFVDALNIAHMERLKTRTILSFDKDFDHIKGIQRKEP